MTTATHIRISNEYNPDDKLDAFRMPHGLVTLTIGPASITLDRNEATALAAVLTGTDATA